MIPRSPTSAEGVIQEIREILGVQTFADVLGVSPDMVYKRCTAEHARDLSFIDVSMGMAIDAMCKEKAGVTPINDFTTWRLSRVGAPSIRESLATSALRLGAEVGDVEREVHELLDHTTDRPCKLSNHKIIELEEHLQNVRRCAGEMETVIKSAGAKA